MFFLSAPQTSINLSCLLSSPPPSFCVCPSVSPTASLCNFLAEPWPQSILSLTEARPRCHLHQSVAEQTHKQNVDSWKICPQHFLSFSGKKKISKGAWNILREKKNPFLLLLIYVNAQVTQTSQSSNLVKYVYTVRFHQLFCDEVLQCFYMCPLFLSKPSLAFLHPPERVIAIA